MRILADLAAREVVPHAHRHTLELAAGVALLGAEGQPLGIEVLLDRRARVGAREEIAEVLAALEVFGVDDPQVVGDGTVLLPHEAERPGDKGVADAGAGP